ncbi:hypothetical protein LEP1GSC008_3946 [Leptospira kirschneri serovar Bulgarica str. Nikolaevo]|uniref:Uncharacterized protein n=1 Tax=Leptospira kirschneri serovar Bulgarica str. Nikolaevo TaxID=1240687 RepID=M6F6P3_9LEPT|nr:hypothetical protein LEP1GSC008_3946 [Leptospira kirschneri serovar Bulgarica str. Nikolaevo]
MDRFSEKSWYIPEKRFTLADQQKKDYIEFSKEQKFESEELQRKFVK